MQRFDTETIRLINLFENVSGAPVKDCLIDSDNHTIYLVIDEGKVGLAIGKDGGAVKNAERVMGKSIKLFEFSKDLVKFVKNLVPQATEVKVRTDNGKTIIEVRVEKKNKAMVIGRDGKKLKVYKELLQRNHNISDIVIR
jgi:N utilization substance protein A